MTTFALAEGETVTCTFTNTRTEVPPPPEVSPAGDTPSGTSRPPDGSIDRGRAWSVDGFPGSLAQTGADLARLALLGLGALLMGLGLTRRRGRGGRRRPRSWREGHGCPNST